MRFDIVTRNLVTQNVTLSDSIEGIFPIVVPGNVSAVDKVVLVYNQVSNKDVTTKTSFNDYGRAIIQLSFFCKSYDKSRTVADDVKTLFDRFSGPVTVGGVDFNVDLIRFVDQHDLGYDEANDVFMIVQDYQLSMTTNFVNNMSYENWASRLPKYEDDEAATTGGVIVGGWYYNTTLKTTTQV